MRRSPLFSSLVYFLLGGLFTYFAINDVAQNGWTFLSYMLVVLATFDIGSGIKLALFYLKYKDQLRK